MKNNNIDVFFALLSGGLWEKDVKISDYDSISYEDILRISEEQSVVGLVTAGLNRVVDTKISQAELLKFIGCTLQIEQRNILMDNFFGGLFKSVYRNKIDIVLVKGQGVAQKYERPLWRTSGDIDLLCERSHYDQLISFLIPLSSFIEEDDSKRKHLAFTINGWVVEAHGTLWTGLSRRVDYFMDKVVNVLFSASRNEI